MVEGKSPYLRLRIGTRNILNKVGVDSNPGAGDNFIVNMIRRKLDLEPIQESGEQYPPNGFELFKGELTDILREKGVQIEEDLEMEDLIWKLKTVLSI